MTTERIKSELRRLQKEGKTIPQIIAIAIESCDGIACAGVVCRTCPLGDHNKEGNIIEFVQLALGYNEQDIYNEVMEELKRADKKHAPMAEKVEGLFTLKCEVMELEREVVRINHDKQAMRTEAIQVAAMSIKFLRDCC